MYFVYILRSIFASAQFYVGRTNNLKRRLAEHNSGASIHTDKHKPWAIRCFISFVDKEKAMAFEQYLKTGSGRAFMFKRLL
jgi:putative endonuclease